MILDNEGQIDVLPPKSRKKDELMNHFINYLNIKLLFNVF